VHFIYRCKVSDFFVIAMPFAFIFIEAAHSFNPNQTLAPVQALCIVEHIACFFLKSLRTA